MVIGIKIQHTLVAGSNLQPPAAIKHTKLVMNILPFFIFSPLLLSSSASPVLTVTCVGVFSLSNSGSLRTDDAVDVMLRAAIVAGDGNKLMVLFLMMLSG